MAAHVDAVRAGQQFAAREVIIEKEAGADHPRGTQVRHVRHHETQRPHDVRRRAQQHLALLQRLAHELEFAVFEIAQAAVNHTVKPRPAASRAIPAPLTPPPTTSTSYSLPCVTLIVS
jgi:hypothetical protein